MLTKGSSVAISLAIFLNSYPAWIPSLAFLETGYLKWGEEKKKKKEESN